MSNLKKIDDFDAHIILYSKGWYGNSRNKLGKVMYFEDIAALLCEWAALDVVLKRDVLDLVMDTFLEYVPLSYQREGFRRLFAWSGEDKTSVTIHELLEMAIGKLSCVKIRGIYELDMTLLPLRFGDKKKELSKAVKQAKSELRELMSGR